MPRPERISNKMVSKEIWSHFKSEELEIIGAYCFAYDGYWPRPKMVPNAKEGKFDYELKPVTKFRQDMIHGKRPWNSYERFRRAVEIISNRMEENQDMGLHFAAAYLNPDGAIDSRDNAGNEIIFDPEEQEKARIVYSYIVTQDGNRWGNPEKLKEFVEGFGGQVLDKLGFTKCEVPPFAGGAIEISEFKRLGDVLGKKMGGPTSNLMPSKPIRVGQEPMLSEQEPETVNVAIEETKRRGRPRKED